MENNVNTLPSKENNRISINWMIFNPKEKEIEQTEVYEDECWDDYDGETIGS